MTKLRLAWFVIFLLLTLAFIGADIYCVVVVVKAKNDELTEEQTVTLNAAPEYNVNDKVYMLSLRGEGDRFKVYESSILEVEVFNTLQEGDTIVYRTYKDNDIQKLAHLGDVTMVTCLKVNGKEVISFGSYYDAMYQQYSWTVWTFGSLAIFFMALASVMFTLYRRARREQAVDKILRRFR